jgi:hypothetical protein
MDVWRERERLWQQIKDALPLITPDGELNTRVKAEAVLAQALPQMPDSDFAKPKPQLQKPRMFNYLDVVQPPCVGDADVRGGAGQSRAGPASAGGSARDLPPSLPGQQPHGVHQQRAAHAAVPGKMTQGLLDLKPLYWNCHTLRTGRRRGTTPYQRLGLPWPAGLRWWDVLK